MIKKKQEELLDAVERCFARYGIDKTNLQDVAAEAGVSRQTVYRYFRDKNALFEEVVLRAMRHFWQGVGLRFSHLDDLENWLLEVILYCVDEVPKDPHHALIRQLDSVDSGMPISLSLEGVQPIVLAFAEQFERAKSNGSLKSGLTEINVGVWAYRLIHTYLMLDQYPMRDKNELRHWLSEYVLSGLFNKQVFAE
ncbi:TetR/AcrR family transcriptional regulator [Parahaliea sp. F7430]|uniref:TetR/AcrR family transcriptional regulator n=1 Tax=Sediminihaliea albiluteola TaxID=2758564 RepID=A0A7W2YKG3_9GAMM|nr:TetR/AcrR family transcriptional regulator [Sediminihaliea albiluteola]MBA6413674.1 TetR/AcrR family transcriptional regulator [Sediminihaliea albiluteola]